MVLHSAPGTRHFGPDGRSFSRANLTPRDTRKIVLRQVNRHSRNSCHCHIIDAFWGKCRSSTGHSVLHRGRHPAAPERPADCRVPGLGLAPPRRAGRLRPAHQPPGPTLALQRALHRALLVAVVLVRSVQGRERMPQRRATQKARAIWRRVDRAQGQGAEDPASYSPWLTRRRAI